VKSKNSQSNSIKENLVTTLRAIVADEHVQIEYEDDLKNNFFAWNQDLVFDKSNVVLPQIINRRLSGVETNGRFLPESLETLQQEPSVGFDSAQTTVFSYRAASDLASCYLLHHDKETHQEINHENEEQKFFNDFEKIRVISRVKNSYLGVVKNILAKIEEDIYSSSNNLSLILLKEIFPQNILPRTKEAAEDLEKNLNKKILQEIKNLIKKTHDQSAFASAVDKILEMLKNQEDSDEKEGEEENFEGKSQKSKNDLSSFGQENTPAKEEENLSPNDVEEGSREIEKQAEISDLVEDDKKSEVMVKLDKSGETEDKIEFKNAYKIFTSKFDEVVFPQKLISKNELELLRDQLDLKLSKLDAISKKMTLKLKRKLLAKKNSFVERDSSSGVLDRKKLTQFVLDPFMEEIWTNNRESEYQNTCLTILLDNSGSMRGNPIVMSAMACEIIAEILEKFSVKTEIIGFTTADWKGGKARKMWELEGRKKNPGRLNELRHIIYKHFNQKFKKAKVNLGLMLKEGILKENIDGEALLFARARLMQQSEKRKILMVISDGMPIDDSTNSANDSDILTDHLIHVIQKIEKQSEIEIVGIGIGHGTERFYKNSISIKSLEELGDVMIEKIVDLL